MESAFAWRHVTRLLLVSGQAVWRRDVCDVAVPLGFARLWWKVRLRGAVPLGSAKHAGVGVNARFGNLTCDFWRESRMKRWFWKLDREHAKCVQ